MPGLEPQEHARGNDDVDSAPGLVSRNACSMAMVRLMPQAEPSTPHWVTSSWRAAATGLSELFISYSQ